MSFSSFHPNSFLNFLDIIHNCHIIIIDWIQKLCQQINADQSPPRSFKELSAQIRKRLQDDDAKNNEYRMLLTLASEGHRIPVEMTELKLLKFELEAREWSLETKKMLTLGNKKFKSEDVCAHLEKGASLQNKFPLTDDDDNISTLRYEEDLKQLIQKANIWLDKYKQSFGDDNAQSSASDSKPHISIQLITDLINQSNQMPIHLGPPLSKLSSISSKIDSWLHNHSSVLSHCQNPIQNYHKSNPPNPCQIQSALAEAPTHLPVTLTEITHLKSLLETAQKLSE